MTLEKSKSFIHVHCKNRTFYTYNQKKETKMTNKIKRSNVSLLEVDHYSYALKKGVFNTEKQKAQREKRKSFEKSRKSGYKK